MRAGRKERGGSCLVNSYVKPKLPDVKRNDESREKGTQTYSVYCIEHKAGLRHLTIRGPWNRQLAVDAL